MNGNDLTNKQFGRLKVIKYIKTDESRNHIWECQCKCGNIIQIKGVQLTRTNGARTCNKCRVIDGKNDIPTHAPWMKEYFKNQDDIYKYTYGSGKKVLVKCPDCGKEKFIAVKDLYHRKNIGCVCNDGISYPEKFVFSLLEQVNEKFEYQYSPNWIKNKRYDFYIPSKNLIIEVDGGIGHGHRCTFNSKYSAEELLEIDIYKEKEALKHKINLVRINAYPSDYETIVKSIKEELSIYFDIEKIDFNACHKFGLTNLIKEVCETWNSIEDVQYISTYYKISDVTVRTYLKKGTLIGWCNYNANKQIQKNIDRRKKKIKVYNNENFLGCFDSCKEFAKYYNSIQKQIDINPKSMINCIRDNKPYKGMIVQCA